VGAVPGRNEGVETAVIVELQLESVGQEGRSLGNGWTGTAGESAIVMAAHPVVLLLCLFQARLLLKCLGNIALALFQLVYLALHQLVLLLQQLHLHFLPLHSCPFLRISLPILSIKPPKIPWLTLGAALLPRNISEAELTEQLLLSFLSSVLIPPSHFLSTLHPFPNGLHFPILVYHPLFHFPHVSIEELHVLSGFLHQA
jgi:hypothetical protein